MEYYSTIKKDEIVSFADKWMKLENISFRNTKVTCFLLYVEDGSKYEFKHDDHMHIYTHRTCFQTKGGGKENNDRE
jgi:hypothetical protein